MPLMGNSRAFGFCTRMRTCRRCEKMSALCIFIEITESFGASSCSADAQPANRPSDALSSAAVSAARRTSGMPMRQHVRRDQHHALLGDQELLRVLIAIEADARTRSEHAVLVD